MLLTQSELVFEKVFAHRSIDSTNAELLRLLAAGLREFTAVISAEQTSGRGRLGRTWQSPAGSSLALSVLLKPQSDLEFNWLTLIAGLSVSEAVASMGVDAAVKWPNDVLVQGKKLCGILASVQDGQVVLGIGVNIAQVAQQLPTAIALDELGIDTEIDALASQIGKSLRANLAAFRADPLSVIERFRAYCLTLGQSVRAEFPDGTSLFGVAESVNDIGQLVILTPEPVALSAADVWHLRN